MTSVFGSGYADSYDLLYGDKDYLAECDLVERVLREHEVKPTQTILDLGCGTGNHAVPLGGRGYEVVGVDRSEEMLAHIRSKTPKNVNFLSGDIRTMDLGRKFDSALMMFAVLGYQYTNSDVLETLRNVRKHINVGGLLIFDVWYGPAVLHVRPSDRAKVIATKDGRIVRFATGDLDSIRQICTVRYEVWRMQGDCIVSRFEESHDMRFFFPLEIDLLLQSSGFSRLRLGKFPEVASDPDEGSWNALVVARAVD